MPAFLERALPLFKDPSVGIVQTPQHFINPDPIQTNLSVARVWPDEQRLFFDVLMPAKDAWGAAFCCGTSSVIRFDQLMRIGGFPTDSVTEDYLLTLRMKETGVLTVYLNERLTIGLAPEGLKEYITQRSRWGTAVYRLTDISLSGAHFKGDPPARIGQTVTCTLRSQIIEARIARITPDGFAVMFDEKLETRVNLVRNFYASDYVSTSIPSCPSV